MMKVTLQDGSGLELDELWLRSCCRCEECGDSTAGIRWLTPSDLDPDVTAASVHAEHGAVHVMWSDGHLSAFDATWLVETMDQGTVQVTSAKSVLDGVPVVGYGDCMADDQALLAAHTALHEVGVVHLPGGPVAPQGTAELAGRFGPVRTTSYGAVQTFVTKSAPKTAAETVKAQHPHTDEPYRYSPPGFLFFHSVAAAPVGEGTTLLVDGFAAAEQLRRDDPDSFELLTTTRIPLHREHAGEVHFEARSVPITLGSDGSIEGIRFNHRCLAPLNPNADNVTDILGALGAFCSIFESAENQIAIHLNSGEMLAFDNHRIMHGRTAFGHNVHRHLRSCNVDRDAVHSSYRVLANRLTKTVPTGLAQGPTT